MLRLIRAGRRGGLVVHVWMGEEELLERVDGDWGTEGREVPGRGEWLGGQFCLGDEHVDETLQTKVDCIGC